MILCDQRRLNANILISSEVFFRAKVIVSKLYPSSWAMYWLNGTKHYLITSRTVDINDRNPQAKTSKNHQIIGLLSHRYTKNASDHRDNII